MGACAGCRSNGGSGRGRGGRLGSCHAGRAGAGARVSRSVAATRRATAAAALIPGVVATGSVTVAGDSAAATSATAGSSAGDSATAASGTAGSATAASATTSEPVRVACGSDGAGSGAGRRRLARLPGRGSSKVRCAWSGRPGRTRAEIRPPGASTVRRWPSGARNEGSLQETRAASKDEVATVSGIGPVVGSSAGRPLQPSPAPAARPGRWRGASPSSRLPRRNGHIGVTDPAPAAG